VLARPTNILAREASFRRKSRKCTAYLYLHGKTKDFEDLGGKLFHRL